MARLKSLARIGAGVVVLAGIVATVGAGPFVHGVTSVSWPTVVIAVALTGVATLSAVWRWRVVASGFGLELSWMGATAAYYRSQFLNAVLPGGIVGDAHRAYRHGRRAGNVALAARAVATERIAGQAVQFVIIALVLSTLGLSSPLRVLAWIVGGAAALLVIAIGIVATVSRGRRLLRRELELLRQIFGDLRRSLKIVASSLFVVASHTSVFVVACVATGVHAPMSELVALALIALTISALPINVGGWGPREGAAASAFAAVGLGAGAGVAASTTFGVLATIAVLPGAVVLIATRIGAARTRRRAVDATAIQPLREEVPA
jgi:uncharacterized membrane protein YbhN (UPF0104 family)